MYSTHGAFSEKLGQVDKMIKENAGAKCRILKIIEAHGHQPDETGHGTVYGHKGISSSIAIKVDQGSKIRGKKQSLRRENANCQIGCHVDALCGEWSDDCQYRQQHKGASGRGIGAQVTVRHIEETSKPVNFDDKLASSYLARTLGM